MAEARRPLLRRVVSRTLRVMLLLLALYLGAGFVTVRLVRGPSQVDGGAAGVKMAAARAPEDMVPLAPPPMTTVAGILSVHTARSHDALGSFDEVAAAASRAGVDFVVLGDHPGDWIDAGVSSLGPVRREGVLLVGGLELVVAEVGRLLVTGLDTLPRRWEDPVSSLLERTGVDGRFVSVIHPRSPRARERWKAADHLSVDAWEALDVSEMARSRLADRWVGYHLASLLASFPLGRGHESLLRLNREGFVTPGVLAYDSMRAVGRLTITGGVNHHPKGRLLGGLFPSYLPFFRTVANHVLVEGGTSGEPVQAWARVAAALREGRSYVSLGDAARAGGFRFGARTGDGRWVEMGGAVGESTGARLVMDLPPRARGALLVRVMRDGREVAWLGGDPGDELSWPVPGRGIYRVEIYRAGLPLGPWRWNLRPWLLSNPVAFP